MALASGCAHVVARVKHALLEDVASKSWLWPDHLDVAEPSPEPPTAPPSVPGSQRQFLPEEIITVRGRWISVKELPSGDIAIKAVRYNPDVVAAVRTVARQHFGHYRGTYFSWVIPRFRAGAARAQLRAIAADHGACTQGVCIHTNRFLIGRSNGGRNKKAPRRALVYWHLGGTGGIRTLDEALHPILP